MQQISNLKEYTVSELNNSIKKIIESAFNFIKVKGEVSQLTKHRSGHLYLTLKDKSETISVICWRTKVSSLSVIPSEGDVVLVEGRITTYSPQSKYQLIADKIEFEGEGSLLKKLEELKKKLNEEGLFNQDLKKKIPLLPKKICIITSESGAVVKDIIHRIKERFPTQLIIYPVKVQGIGSAKEIKAAIEVINNEKNKKNYDFEVDLIILARGGGSFEDLLSFNDEYLVRAIFSSEIPIISAIGHETDVTLCDFVSDLRAPTPTAAAEFSVPVKKDIQIKLDERLLLINKLINSILEKKLNAVDRIFNKIFDCKQLIERRSQTLDLLENKLVSNFENLFKGLRISYKNLLIKFQPKLYSGTIKIRLERIRGIEKNLNFILFSKINFNKQLIKEKSKLINSLSYKNVLKRGYSVIRCKNKIVNDDILISEKQEIEIEFYKSKTKALKIK